MSAASSARDPTQPGLPNRREGGHCVKTRLAPVRTSAEPSLIPHAVAERLQRRQCLASGEPTAGRGIRDALATYRVCHHLPPSPFVCVPEVPVAAAPQVR